MGEQIRDFRDLKVYQNAFEARREIFRISKIFPIEERYSLTDQIRRSTRSVCANITSAWRKRRYPPAFISKLGDADEEAAETTVWLDIALDDGYLKPEAHKELLQRYDRICAQLVTMMSAPEKWCHQYGKNK